MTYHTATGFNCGNKRTHYRLGSCPGVRPPAYSYQLVGGTRATVGFSTWARAVWVTAENWMSLRLHWW